MNATINYTPQRKGLTMNFENGVLVVGGTLTGLLAGLFYAFNVAVVPSLRNLNSSQHIAAMQSINAKIQNPVFFLSFFGPTLLLPLAAYLHRGDRAEFAMLAAAAVIFIVGANGITMAVHIPLNEKLDKVDVSRESSTEAEQIREEYQGAGSTWMRWHTARTLATTASTALVFIVCLSK